MKNNESCNRKMLLMAAEMISLWERPVDRVNSLSFQINRLPSFYLAILQSAPRREGRLARCNIRNTDIYADGQSYEYGLFGA